MFSIYFSEQWRLLSYFSYPYYHRKFLR